MGRSAPTPPLQLGRAAVVAYLARLSAPQLAALVLEAEELQAEFRDDSRHSDGSSLTLNLTAPASDEDEIAQTQPFFDDSQDQSSPSLGNGGGALSQGSTTDTLPFIPSQSLSQRLSDLDEHHSGASSDAADYDAADGESESQPLSQSLSPSPQQDIETAAAVSTPRAGTSPSQQSLSPPQRQLRRAVDTDSSPLLNASGAVENHSELRPQPAMSATGPNGPFALAAAHAAARQRAEAAAVKPPVELAAEEEEQALLGSPEPTRHRAVAAAVSRGHCAAIVAAPTSRRRNLESWVVTVQPQERGGTKRPRRGGGGPSW